MLLDQSYQEYQNLPPKLDFKIGSQQTGNDGCTKEGLIHHLAISMARYVSLGCISGSVLPNECLEEIPECFLGKIF
jgi:hypothetical protein